MHQIDGPVDGIGGGVPLGGGVVFHLPHQHRESQLRGTKVYRRQTCDKGPALAMAPSEIYGMPVRVITLIHVLKIGRRKMAAATS